ncbi:MAG: ribosome recycling factor [Oscillospiraceae bacterium]|jgi:ribosome recycling factor|nr:ribosome recycling factor [Oscillospiraceae bacterium]
MNPTDKKEITARMEKTVDSVKSQFATVRAGRANPAVLDQISVDYYGQATPINQIATIAVPDPRTITIQPWEANMLKTVEKAIQTSELGINPNNDGKIIRLSFPPLTEERRKELVKQVKGYSEDGKVAIRNIRRDCLEKFKKQQKNSEITEDDLKDSEKDLQKLTDDYVKKIDEVTAVKEKELYEI